MNKNLLDGEKKNIYIQISPLRVFGALGLPALAAPENVEFFCLRSAPTHSSRVRYLLLLLLDPQLRRERSCHLYFPQN